MTAAANRDIWAEWLLQTRHGGDADELERTLAHLAPIRDRVLASANLTPGETALDVGTGDGLIAFGALEAVGDTGTVIFSDISENLLAASRQIAEQAGVVGRCRFVAASADDLAGVPSESVDTVFTRSVLIYVKDKLQAFQEFHRVLRPGGRVSIFEPINRFNLERRPDTTFFGYDVAPVKNLAAKVSAAYRASGPPLAASPMFDFDERDLFELAQRAHFAEVRLDLQAVLEHDAPEAVAKSWSAFVGSSGNPLEPTVAEMIEQALTATEAKEFIAHLRPRVERGQSHTTLAAHAYLWARKAA
jgi:ubiquinone/menaquinone biosynthesis C-methylase UbiE